MAGNQNLVAKIIINAQDNASKAFDSIRENAGKLAAALVTTFTASIFKNAIDEAAQFELQLDKVAAKGGYTSKEMDTLRTSAQSIGAEFSVSGTKAAEGLEVLAAAGLKSSEAVKALPSVLKLAKSEAISINDAAELVTNTVSSMGLSFDDTGKVANIFVKAANLSTVSAKELGESFKNVNLIARNSKYSLEEVAGMMDVLAKNGLKGGEAGTSLAAAIRDIENPTTQTSQALRAAGIESTNLVEVMEALKNKGSDTHQIISKFGDEAKRALIAFSIEGKAGLASFTSQLKATGDTAGDTAATMAENFKGSQSKLSATFDNLKVALGTPILKPLANAFNGLSDQFNTLLSSGVVDKVGQSLATAFKAGSDQAIEFIKQIDFTKVGENVKDFASKMTQTFEVIGSNAKDAGNVISLITGIFKTGFNVIQSAGAILESGIAGNFGTIRKTIGEVSVGIGEFLSNIPGLSKVSDQFKNLGEKLKTSGDLIISLAMNLKKEAGTQFDEATNSAINTQKAFDALSDSTGKTTKSLDEIWKVSDTVNEALTGVSNSSTNAAQALGECTQAEAQAAQKAENLANAANKSTASQESHTQKIYKTVDALGKVSYSTQQFAGSTEVAITKTSGLISTLADVKDKKTTITTDTTQPEEKVSALTKSIDTVPDKESKITAETATAQQKVDTLKGKVEEIPTEHQTTASVTSQGVDTVQQEIASIPRDVYTTVHVKTVQENSNGGQIQYFAKGGTPDVNYNFQRREGGLGGYGGGDTVPAMLEPGEWIIKKESVKKYGSGFMAKLNAGQIQDLPHFAFGGSVTDAQNQASSQSTNALNSFNANYMKKVEDLLKEINEQRHGEWSGAEKKFILTTQSFIDGVVKGRSNPYEIADMYGVIPSLFDAVTKEHEANKESGYYEKYFSKDKNTQSKSKPLFKAAGGHIKGKGTGTSDEIPAMLSNGEYVIKADAVDKVGVNTLDKINNGQKPQGFASGGLVGKDLQDEINKKQLEFNKNEKDLLDIYNANANTKKFSFEEWKAGAVKANIPTEWRNKFYSEFSLNKELENLKAQQQVQNAIDDAQAAIEAPKLKEESEKKAEAEKQAANELNQRRESLQLSGDKVGLENLDFEQSSKGLTGKALEIANQNHQTRLKEIEKQKQKEKDDEAKQAAERQAAEVYRQKQESLQLSGDKISLENLNFEQSSKGLTGEALALATKNHQTRLAELQKQKKAADESNKAIASEKTQAPEIQQSANNTPPSQPQSNNEIIIKFVGLNGEQSQGSFSKQNADSFVSILKEAASRGATF